MTVSSAAFLISSNPFHNLKRSPRTSKIFCCIFSMVASRFRTCVLCPVMDFTKQSNFLTPLTFSGTNFTIRIFSSTSFSGINQSNWLTSSAILPGSSYLWLSDLDLIWNLWQLPFSVWFFWRGRIPWIWQQRFWWCFYLPFISSFVVFLSFLSCSSEQGLIIITSNLAVTSNPFVTGSICFILERDVSPVSLSDMIE